MTMQLNNMSDDIQTASVPVGQVAGPAQRGIYRVLLKRLFDIAVVLVSGVLVVPIVAILALLIMCDGANPFYTSDRVGRGGRTFRMLKLRTMVADADERLEGYLAANPDARVEWDQTQKLKVDPRITRLGRFLRKSSLDELPQFWNVLVGEMSMVGPRPMMPAQRPIYVGLAYYALRPGVTGLWQISDRNNCTFERRAEIDGEYERSLSFWSDVMIMLKTFRAVTGGTGY